jgi:cation:H+ antiporter
MWIDILLFICGFVLLIKGADLIVDGASSFAKKYGIPTLVIGLTIVAFGTSAPELIVSVLASLRGSAGVALGNIIGSNIANTLLILGAAAIIYPLAVKQNTVNKEIPFSLLALLAAAFLVNDRLLEGSQAGGLTRIDGLILILFFVIFMYYTFGMSRNKSGLLETLHEEKIRVYHNFYAILMILAGLLGLYFGGVWIVEGGVLFAKMLGLSEEFIGLTVIAVGTSLPELAASGVAAYKKRVDIAVGNAIGSNIFNLLWVLGASSIIRPLPFAPFLNADLSALFLFTVLLLFLIYSGKRNVLERHEGAVLVFLYFSYLVFLVGRG